jgi:hypothetical protein
LRFPFESAIASEELVCIQPLSCSSASGFTSKFGGTIVVVVAKKNDEEKQSI